MCLENQFYNDYQIEHYIDNGCLCVLCSKKRNKIYNDIKKGLNTNDKIIHNEVINEVKQNKIQKITDLANKITNIKNKISHKKITKLSDNAKIYGGLINNRQKKMGSINFS